MSYKESETQGLIPIELDPIPKWKKVISATWEELPGKFVQHYELGDVILEKPLLIKKAEQQYLSLWHLIFGAEDNTYESALKEDVMIKLADAASQNPSLYTYSYPLEKSFEIISQWWLFESCSEKFHPYPWMIDDVNMYEFFS